MATPERIVIVGAGPAGFATARAYRDRGGAGAVTLVGEEPIHPYQRPPLSKEFLRGDLERDELALERPAWFQHHQVRVRLGTKVSEIDPKERLVVLADGGELRADTIVLATGAEPTRPKLEGSEHPDLMTFRRLPDSVALAERCGGSDGSLVVVGTGFIGCEIAASLTIAGSRVTLIGQELLPQIERLGEEAAGRIAEWLEELGVEFLGGVELRAIHDGRSVELVDGRRIDGSCVVLATGVRPRGELAAAAGLETRDGAIVVDDTMRSVTYPECVLAVGDVADAYNVRAGRRLRVEHWGDALGHGEVAGATLADGSGRWDAVPGFWSTIGEHTIKYAAWGDGYDESRLVEHHSGAFTVWYGSGRTTVGVLTHNRDVDYEKGRELIAHGLPLP